MSPLTSMAKLAARDAMTELASRKESKWKLADQTSDWTEKRGNMLRAMLRHIDQTVIKSRSRAGQSRPSFTSSPVASKHSLSGTKTQPTSHPTSIQTPSKPHPNSIQTPSKPHIQGGCQPAGLEVRGPAGRGIGMDGEGERDGRVGRRGLRGGGRDGGEGEGGREREREREIAPPRGASSRTSRTGSSRSSRATARTTRREG